MVYIHSQKGAVRWISTRVTRHQITNCENSSLGVGLYAGPSCIEMHKVNLSDRNDPTMQK